MAFSRSLSISQAGADHAWDRDPKEYVASNFSTFIHDIMNNPSSSIIIIYEES